MKARKVSTSILQHLEKLIFKKKKVNSSVKELVVLCYKQHTKTIWPELLLILGALILHTNIFLSIAIW